MATGSSTHRQTPWASLFARCQTQGAQRRRWIANSNEPGCYIHRSELTFSYLRTMHPSGVTWNYSTTEESMSTHLIQEIPELNDPPMSYRDYTLLSPYIYWSGTTGPGIVVINQIDRTHFADEIPPVAPVSGVTQAIYEHFFHINDLRHVYVNNVVNTGTRELVQGQLYTPPRTTTRSYIHDQLPDWDLRIWTYESPEYDAILGTRIGKVVAYLVLGAFERGTRKISRIVTYSLRTRPKHFIHMRFDIETI